MSGNVVPLRPALPAPAQLRRWAAGSRWRLPVPRDARLFQILFLASLLGFGVLARDFTLQPVQMLLAFAAGLATQAVWIARLHVRNKGYLSAVITCFGLSILLRADSVWVHPLAACLAISAKFVIRVQGKHLCNPASLGVVLATTLLPGTWISSGQWGNALAAAAWFVALGGFVTTRARRADIAWVFLCAWLGALALRVAWLGQSWAVWWHQFGSGALLLFAFFMISDPQTIPDDRRARVLYALAVAALAYGWQYVLFRPNALFYSLLLATPLVPLLDRLFPAARFDWRGTTHERAAQ